MPCGQCGRSDHNASPLAEVTIAAMQLLGPRSHETLREMQLARATPAGKAFAPKLRQVVSQTRADRGPAGGTGSGAVSLPTASGELPRGSPDSNSGRSENRGTRRLTRGYCRWTPRCRQDTGSPTGTVLLAGTLQRRQGVVPEMCCLPISQVTCPSSPAIYRDRPATAVGGDRYSWTSTGVACWKPLHFSSCRLLHSICGSLPHSKPGGHNSSVKTCR